MDVQHIETPGLEVIYQFFPGLTGVQRCQLESLGSLYADWNAKINVVSRRDIGNLYMHHVLHSLSIAKFLSPVADSRFMDLGCGGGFPGIPLAILWPQAHLHLVDRIGKKVRVAQEIAAAIGLRNVTFQHGDAGEVKEKYDFVLSRAVMSLEELVKISRKLIAVKNRNQYPNGLICLKGGDLEKESRTLNEAILTFPIKEFFPGVDFFEGKDLVYVPINVNDSKNH